MFQCCAGDLDHRVTKGQNLAQHFGKAVSFSSPEEESSFFSSWKETVKTKRRCCNGSPVGAVRDAIHACLFEMHSLWTLASSAFLSCLLSSSTSLSPLCLHPYPPLLPRSVVLFTLFHRTHSCLVGTLAILYTWQSSATHGPK